jgi:probable rRNA maturation factor
MSKNKLALVVQYADPRLRDLVTRPLLRRWVQAALETPAELTVRLVDNAEGRALNRDYRGKDYATNVLTFAYSEDEAATGAQSHEPADLTRADLILCTDVLQAEAAAQNKSLLAHAAHLVVHGVMHAQGYDHDNAAEADQMELRETAIMARLGFADPYLASDASTGTR